MIPRHYLFSFLESIKRGDKTMSEKVLNNVRYILKHDTEENWKKASNFSPKNGEPIIYDIDSTHAKQRIKIGDGSTNVNNLPFIANDNLLESIKYVSESELSSEENLDASYQYCVTDLLSYDDLNSDLQAKIDKAASVDNKLDKVTEAGAYPRLYNIKPDGTQDTVSFTSSAVAYAVVQRDSNGDVTVPVEPSSQNSAASKNYIDSLFVAKKNNTDDVYYAYGYHNSEQVSYGTSIGINPNYLVSRDANGDVLVLDTPVSNNGATSKTYVDNGFVKKIVPEQGVDMFTYASTLQSGVRKETYFELKTRPKAWALPMYDGDGDLAARLEPTYEGSATSKKYVDAQISLVQDIANGANEDAANALTIAQEAKDLVSSGTGRSGYGWQDGAGGPSGEPTDNRIYYLDRSTGEYYKWCDENCGLLQWVYKGSLKGPAGTAGAPGQNGAGWTLGSGSPSGEPSNNLFFYLDTSTGNYYHWEEDYNNCGLLAWVLKGNLKGPKGDKGATGASGDSGIGSSYDAPSIINISNRCYGGVGGVANAVYGEGAFYRYLKVNNAQVESGTDLVISAETSMFPANLSIDSYGESSAKMASIVYSSSSVSSGNPGYSINVDSEGKVLTITSEDGAAHEVNFVMQYV